MPIIAMIAAGMIMMWMAYRRGMMSVPGNSPPKSRNEMYTPMSGIALATPSAMRSEEHTSELQSRGHLVCRLLLEKKKGRDDKAEKAMDEAEKLYRDIDER